MLFYLISLFFYQCYFTNILKNCRIIDNFTSVIVPICHMAEQRKSVYIIPEVMDVMVLSRMCPVCQSGGTEDYVISDYEWGDGVDGD